MRTRKGVINWVRNASLTEKGNPDRSGIDFRDGLMTDDLIWPPAPVRPAQLAAALVGMNTSARIFNPILIYYLGQLELIGFQCLRWCGKGACLETSITSVSLLVDRLHYVVQVMFSPCGIALHDHRPEGPST